MITFKLNKLVRDNLPRLYVEQQQTPEVKVLKTKNQLLHALKLKLDEELIELSNETKDTNKLLAELADVQEVIDCFMEIGGSHDDISSAQLHVHECMRMHGIRDRTLRELQQKKNEKVGSFRMGQWVIHLSMQDDDTWVSYYRERDYPEVKL